MSLALAAGGFVGIMYWCCFCVFDIVEFVKAPHRLVENDLRCQKVALKETFFSGAQGNEER